MFYADLDSIITERLEVYDLEPSGGRIDTVKSWILWEEIFIGNLNPSNECVDSYIETLYGIKKVADNKLSRKLYKGNIIKESKGYLIVRNDDKK